MLPNTSAGVINKNLSWEETNQYDVGLDISLLDYRFKVNLDYYYRYTKGQLNRITLPETHNTSISSGKTVWPFPIGELNWSS